MDGILAVLKEAVTSKKLIMAVAAAVAAAAGKIGLDLPTETVGLIVGPIVAYIIGQGWADRGKEAAKVQGAVQLATEGKLSDKAVAEKLV